MFPGRNVEGAQDVVGAAQRRRLPVDTHLPAVGIVDFGEDGYGVAAVVGFIHQAIGCVAGQTDGGEAVAVAFDQAFQGIFEAGVYHGCYGRIGCVQGVNLFVGIVHVLYLVDKPRVAVGVGVQDGHGLSLLSRG